MLKFLTDLQRLPMSFFRWKKPMLNSGSNIPYAHSVLPGSFHSMCTSPCTSCTHLQYLDFHLSISLVYVLYSSAVLVTGSERTCCLISCLIYSFNVRTTMLIFASIICVNNVWSISLRAVENASLLMPTIRMKKFLHTSPFFLIQGINQDWKTCCFQRISCVLRCNWHCIVANIACLSIWPLLP